MDTLPPDPVAADMRLKPAPGAVAPNRSADYLTAAIIATLAFGISPVAMRLLTGRSELNFRPFLLSVTFDLFLLTIAGAVLARGRLRRFFFALIACTIPFVMLAALETLAGAVHLSDRVATFQDLSTIKRGSDWGPGMNHLAAEKDGFVLYRSWSGNGVTINALGLRTPPPTPKSPGEHRIAVSGSSNVWGFALADADTIPALLQVALRRNGHDEISVYNFGIEDATLAKELMLLQHFKDIYGIDQVVFFSGGADVFREYYAIGGQPLEASPFGKRIASFELYRTIDRIRTHWFGPSSDRLARISEALPLVPKKNRLTEGILAANDYCRVGGLRCDFVLTPLLASRRSPVGTEIQLMRSYKNMYPGFETLTSQLYRDALALGPPGKVHDFTEVFDRNSQQVYIDGGHNNEAGNSAIVDALLPIILPALPPK